MHLHIDPSIAGISGNMFLGACLEIGLSPDLLEAELRKLNLHDPWTLHVEKSERGSIAGSFMEFRISEGGPAVDAPFHNDHDHDHDHDHGHSHGHGRHFSTIQKLIEASDLCPSVKQRAVSIFRRLGEAEAAVHGTTLEEVHFHEVGALDSILDIVGAAIALEALEITGISASIPVDGEGSVECAHGTFPVPVPAVLNILKNCPLRQVPVPAELVTPTGAAILAELSEGRFGPMPEGTVTTIGYGLGSRRIEGRPNVLRLILSNPASEKADADPHLESITLLETNLDDITGEEIGHTLDTLLSAGALDVAVIPLTMKKSRPGHQLQVMCRPEDAEALMKELFSATGTLGVRIRTQQRRVLQRTTQTVQTAYGPIRVKISHLDGQQISRKPEAEDVQEAAIKHQIPIRRVLEAVFDSPEEQEHFGHDRLPLTAPEDPL